MVIINVPSDLMHSLENSKNKNNEKTEILKGGAANTQIVTNIVHPPIDPISNTSAQTETNFDYSKHKKFVFEYLKIYDKLSIILTQQILEELITAIKLKYPDYKLSTSTLNKYIRTDIKHYKIILKRIEHSKDLLFKFLKSFPTAHSTKSKINFEKVKSRMGN